MIGGEKNQFMRFMQVMKIFTKAHLFNILRINNICENIKNIASMINNSDLLKKVK